jgi:regulation of enolase protein 1 (concanavalin A-like superfamily)
MSISWGAMTWVNQPRRWRWDGSDLFVRTEHGSDFWRTTETGEDRDTGHAFLARERGDLAVEVTVAADYQEQHDQAGVMIRLSHLWWLKAGVQLVDGDLVASVVNTRDASDWSILPLPEVGPDTPVRLRVTRTGNALDVRCAADDGEWHPLRLAHFPPEIPVGVGPMCASPRRAGLDVSFTACEIQTSARSWENRAR